MNTFEDFDFMAYAMPTQIVTKADREADVRNALVAASEAKKAYLKAQQELFAARAMLASENGKGAVVVDHAVLDTLINQVVENPELSIRVGLGKHADAYNPDWVQLACTKPLSKRIRQHLVDTLQDNPKAQVLRKHNLLDVHSLVRNTTVSTFFNAIRKAMQIAAKLEDAEAVKMELEAVKAELARLKSANTMAVTGWKEEVVKLRNQGKKVKEIMEIVGKSKATIERVLKAAK